MKLFLCPPQLTLDCGELLAAEEIQSGTSFLPWSGEVLALPDNDADAGDHLHHDDPRLQHGVVDSAAGVNWVRYLPHHPLSAVTNMVVGCGPMGEPVFLCVRKLYQGDRVVGSYQDLREELRIPAVLLLRVTLYHKYVETAIQDAPCNLARRMTGCLSPASEDSLDRSSEGSGSGTDSPKLCDDEPSVITFLNYTFPSNMKGIRNKRLLPCDTCGKEFDRPSLLERHIRIHTGEKPYVCDFCKKGFSTSSSLNTHRRIHTGEKPHVCKTCGKCFTASSNLYYHRMTHVKDKPHPCEECPRSFSTPGDLRNHMKVHSSSSNTPTDNFNMHQYDIAKFHYASNYNSYIQ